ncbi:uncharacterized protein B0T15DRAFT_82858 [Chaetomium strumarium]|uniref:Uncharacterized protein n=1 Tax=Chaetomium strumarium TaxID=1170767 RepID=A0AAJ0H561_9PEZI|nr:hypothetical protein B0T15DRAFT_82858 [Chaetomium strumarium]
MAQVPCSSHINAEVKGLYAANGGLLNAKIKIDNSRHQYICFINGRYTPEEALQFLHPDIEKYAWIVNAIPSPSDEPIPLPLQDTAVTAPLENGNNKPSASRQADSEQHLRDIANATALFSMLEGHEDDYSRCRRDCDLDDTEPFSDAFYEDCLEAHEADIRSALTQWLASPSQSVLLTIDGTEYTHRQRWPTRFAVEAVHDAQWRKQQVCHCFCGEQPDDVGSWPSLVVRHLLAQLPAVRGAKNGSARQRKRGGVELDCAQIPASVLWAAFKDRMAQADINSVTIVLDEIDALYDRCNDHDEGVKRFADFVHGLSWLMRSGPVLRVMVTSWSSEVLDVIRNGVATELLGD